MYYTANRILRNSSDAEDVVHQAFLKVIEILGHHFFTEVSQKRVRCSSRHYRAQSDRPVPRKKQRRNVLPLVEEYVGAAPAAD